MAYLIEQIFWYLLAGFVLGVVIGWIAGSAGAKKKIAELEAQIAELKAQTASKAKGTPVETIEGIGSGFGQRLRDEGIDPFRQNWVQSHTSTTAKALYKPESDNEVGCWPYFFVSLFLCSL